MTSKPEPVAWTSDDGRLFKSESEARRNSWNNASPLYSRQTIYALLAEVEALQRELGELHMHAKRRDEYATVKAVETLAAVKEAEALREDAERYRFLRAASEDGDPDLRRWTDAYETLGRAGGRGVHRRRHRCGKEG